MSPRAGDGRWKKISSKIDYRNPWFRVRRDRVVRPDGKKGRYHVVETRGPAVFIVAVDERRRVCLVNLYRYPTRRWSWEVPGGNSDGQDPLAAAKRELREETGLAASRWKSLGRWQSVNGLSSEWSHAFLARGLRATGKDQRAEEGIRAVRFVALPEAMGMARRGAITDGQTLAALLAAALRSPKVFSAS